MRVRRKLGLLAVLLAVVGLATAAAAIAAPDDPVITITAKPPDPSTSSGGEFKFIADHPNVTFECVLDGALSPSCASPFPVSGLADGPHSFVVTGTDSAGRTGSTSYSWTVDVIALSGPPQITASRAASFGFALTTGAPATFECGLDGDRLPCGDPPKTYEDLPEGTHTFHVWSTDANGEVGDDQYSWTIDATPPAVTIASGPFATTAERVARFEFGVDDANAKVQCAVDDSGLADCSSPYTTPELADGGHTFVVQATDAAGNIARVSYTWTIASFTLQDTTPPDIAEPLDYFVSYRYAELTWTQPADADFDHVTVFQLTAAGDRVALYSGTKTSYADSKFNNGVDHRYEVVSYDRTGNESPAATLAIPSSTLLASPRRGATVRRPPLLAWAPISGARFYNVQLFRNGRKILSTWPKRPRVRLATSWPYKQHRYKLTRGTYEWYVWPAFAQGRSVRYGPALGHSSFRKR